MAPKRTAFEPLPKAWKSFSAIPAGSRAPGRVFFSRPKPSVWTQRRPNPKQRHWSCWKPFGAQDTDTLGIAHHKAQAGVASQRAGRGIRDGEHGEFSDMGVGYGFRDGRRVFGETDREPHIALADRCHLPGEHATDRVQQMARELEPCQAVRETGRHGECPSLSDNVKRMRAIDHPDGCPRGTVVDIALQRAGRQQGGIREFLKDGDRIVLRRHLEAGSMSPDLVMERGSPSIRRDRNTRCMSVKPAKPKAFARRMSVEGCTPVCRAVSATVWSAKQFGSASAYCAIR